MNQESEDLAYKYQEPPKWRIAFDNADDESTANWKADSELLTHDVGITWNGNKIAHIERPEGMFKETFNREHRANSSGLKRILC